MVKRKIFIVGISAVLLVVTGVAYAEQIRLDLSNASVSVTGTETFRIYHTMLQGVEGSYWVDFQWNPTTYVFEPMTYSADDTAKGVLVCVSYHNTQASVPLSVAQFKLDNFSDDMTITIDKILVYDDNGTLLCEGPTDWENFRSVIGPNAGGWFTTTHLAGWCNNLPETGWANLKIYWSSSGGGKPFPLHGITTQIQRYEQGGNIMSRSSLECTSLQE
jgi:hypothetical protein